MQLLGVWRGDCTLSGHNCCFCECWSMWRSTKRCRQMCAVSGQQWNETWLLAVWLERLLQLAEAIWGAFWASLGEMVFHGANDGFCVSVVKSPLNLLANRGKKKKNVLMILLIYWSSVEGLPRIRIIYNLGDNLADLARTSHPWKILISLSIASLGLWELGFLKCLVVHQSIWGEDILGGRCLLFSFGTLAASCLCLNERENSSHKEVVNLIFIFVRMPRALNGSDHWNNILNTDWKNYYNKFTTTTGKNLGSF